jgi:hypothetical protein
LFVLDLPNSEENLEDDLGGEIGAAGIDCSDDGGIELKLLVSE